MGAHVSIGWIPRTGIMGSERYVRFEYCLIGQLPCKECTSLHSISVRKCDFPTPLPSLIIRSLIFANMIDENDTLLWFQFAFLLLWSSIILSRKNTRSGLPGRLFGAPPVTHHYHLHCFSIPFSLFSFPWNKSETDLLKKKSPHGERNITDIITKLHFFGDFHLQWLRICLPMQGTRVQSPGLGRSHMPRSN